MFALPARVLLVLPLVVAMVAVGFLAAAATPPPSEGPVPRANCGPGSQPETGIQGQVPRADRESGRSAKGYRCNLELVGRQRGDGSSWVNESYGKCAYLARRYLGNPRPGVRVVDVSDAANPRLAGMLTTQGMQAPWESLRLERRRGLLAAVFVPIPPGIGGGFLDVYDVATDCRSPRRVGSISALALLEGGDLLGALAETLEAAQLFGHEAAWSPDGRVYWSAAGGLGRLTAIDMTDPTKPRLLWAGSTGVLNHGFGFSADGNQLYIAESGSADQAVTAGGLGKLSPSANGLKIFDISDIQARRRNPRVRELGHVFWTDGGLGQHTIPISSAGHRYVVFVDEAFQGGARIIDVADPTRPRIVSKLKLEIQMPDAAGRRARDLAGEGFFGYEAHYCTVDRHVDPTALACGYFQSGVRVFDIRDPLRPREIAYYNPPAQTGKNAELTGSEHAGAPGNLDIAQGGSPPRLHGAAGLTADWCSSPPRFVEKDQLWVACQDNGFMVLRFTNGAWPLDRCLDTSGRIRGRRVGPIALGRTRAAQRRAVDGRLLSRGGIDRYCLAGGGALRVGYPTRRLRRTHPHPRIARRAGSRALLALTSSPRATLRGARRGSSTRALRRRLRGEAALRIGRITWIVAAGTRGTNHVFRTDGRKVLEVGIADRRLMRGPRATRRLLGSWRH